MQDLPNWTLFSNRDGVSKRGVLWMMEMGAHQWFINSSQQQMMNTFPIIIRQEQFGGMNNEHNRFTARLWDNQHNLSCWANKLILLEMVVMVSQCRQCSCQILGKSKAYFAYPLVIKHCWKIPESMIVFDDFRIRVVQKFTSHVWLLEDRRVDP